MSGARQRWRAMPGQAPAARRTPLLLLASLGLLIALVTACSSKQPTAATTSTTVTIHAVDFSFNTGAPQTLAAGRVHFVLKNDSKSILHELWVYPQQQPQLQAMLAQKRTGQETSETDYLQGMAGKVEDLPPGKSGSFDAQLSPGTYELACFQVADMNGQKIVHTPGQMMVAHPHFW
jgi:uncharacterized cupredoxin-like copper-binding protein